MSRPSCPRKHTSHKKKTTTEKPKSLDVCGQIFWQAVNIHKKRLLALAVITSGEPEAALAQHEPVEVRAPHNKQCKRANRRTAIWNTTNENPVVFDSSGGNLKRILKRSEEECWPKRCALNILPLHRDWLDCAQSKNKANLWVVFRSN